MIHIEMSSEEVDVLRQVLEHQILQMDVEVDRTDTHDFKKMLQHRRDLLKQILARLSPVAA